MMARLRPASISPMLTDLYQLTMMQSYLEHGLTETATFEFFVRKLPASRNFLMAAGLEQALDFLEGLAFDDSELEWLTDCGRFSGDFIDYLAGLRFRGDVHAMPEGTLFFADEPILRVTAPLPMAQLVESRLINILHFQTVIASKAARMRLAAPKAKLIDFGLRRTHEAEAGLLAARAAFIAGLDGTSTVLAGQRFGIPVFGTMAHAFVQAHDSELDAFEHFARSHPDNAVLLIDTYDTEAAAEKIIELVEKLKPDGIDIHGVRLDSGDLAAHARHVRRILDAGGLNHVRILASGNIDEYRLLKLAEAPIDGFGIGTRMNTSADAPYLDCAYKLQEYAGIPRRKKSEGKATWPGRKQVFRKYNNGRIDFDVIALDGEDMTGEALLHPVMRQGRRIEPAPALIDIREYAAGQLQSLPHSLQSLTEQAAAEVRVSENLKRLAAETDRRLSLQSLR